MSHDNEDNSLEQISQVDPYAVPNSIDAGAVAIRTANRRTYPAGFWTTWIVVNTSLFLLLIFLVSSGNAALFIAILLLPAGVLGLIRSAVFSYRQYHSSFTDREIQCPRDELITHFCKSIGVGFLIFISSVVAFMSTCLAAGSVISVSGANQGYGVTLGVSAIAFFASLILFVRLSAGQARKLKR